MRSRIRLTTPFGSAWKVAPHFLEAQLVWPFREQSTLNLQYPKGGINSALLNGECEAVYEYQNASGVWVEPLDSRFRLSDESDDRLDRTQTTRVDFIALIPSMLQQAFVWDPTGLATDSNGDVVFSAVSPGRILRTLFNNAKTRGWGSALSVDFTDTTDSAGQPWSGSINLTVQTNQNLFSILSTLAEQGVVDWAGSGRTLQVYNPDATLGRDKSSLRMPSVDGEMAAPVDKSYRDRATIMRVVGDDNKKWDRSIADSPWGRLEAIMGAGGVTDEGTANLFSNEAVLKASAARVSRTREFDQTSTYLPHRDYRCGDYVSYQTEAGFERMRVLSMSLTLGQRISGHAILGDKFEDALISAARKTQSLVVGKATGGNGKQPGPVNDWRTPVSPSGLLGVSSVYTDGKGLTQGAVSMSWSHTGKATDGTVMDIDRFEFMIQPVGGTWQSLRSTPGDDRQVYVSPVRHLKDDGTPETYNLRVRAVGANSRTSSWNVTNNLLMKADTTPPPVPSTLAATVSRAVFSLAWDGKSSAAGSMGADFNHIEMEASDAITGPWVPVGSQLTVAGTVSVAYLGYGSRWFRARSVDDSGNKSAWSTLATAVSTPLVEEIDIKTELDRIDLAYDGVITEAGLLGDRLDIAEFDVTAAEDRLVLAEADIDNAFIEVGKKSNKVTGTDGAKTFHNVLAWNKSGSVVPSPLVIDTPITPTAKMCNIRITGYSYELDSADVDIRVAFYAYTTAMPVYNSSMAQTSLGAKSVTAKVARKIATGTISIILEGGNWSYPKLSVPEALIGHTAAPDTWQDGWTVRESPNLAEYDFIVTPPKRDLEETSQTALSAQETATNALTMAGSATAAYYSTSVPSGVARTNRDIWRQTDANKDVIGEWYWDGVPPAGSWVKTLISSQSISNLDVGKLTVSTGVISDLVAQHVASKTAAFQTVDVKNLFVTTGTMAEAVITKLFTEVVMSKRITTDMMAIGTFDNMITDPEFKDATLVAGRFSGSSTGITIKVSSVDGRNFAAIPVSASQLTLRMYNHPTAGSVGEAQFTPIVPEAKYRVRYQANTTSGTAGTRPACRYIRPDGTQAYVALDNSGYAVAGTSWAWVDYVWTAPADAAGAYFDIQRQAGFTGILNVKSMMVTRMNGGELTVDGSITTAALAAKAVKAEKIDVNDLAADTAFVGAMSTNILTVGSVPRNALQFQVDDMVPFPTWPTSVQIAAGQDLYGADKMPAAYAYSTGGTYLRNGQERVILINGATFTNQAVADLSGNIPASAGDKVYVYAEGLVAGSTPNWYLRLRVQAYGANGTPIEYISGTPLDPAQAVWYNDPDINARTRTSWVQTMPPGTVSYRVNMYPSVIAPATYTTMTGFWILNKVSVRPVMAGVGQYGRSAELSPQGLRLFNEDGGEVVSLTSMPPNYLGILDGEGTTLASLSDDGTVAGRGLNVEQDPTFMGEKLFGNFVNYETPNDVVVDGVLDIFPRGVVAYGTYDFRDWIPIPSGYVGEAALLELAFNGYPDRAYRVTMTPISIIVNGSGNLHLNVRRTVDGTRPTLDSTLIYKNIFHGMTEGTTNRNIITMNGNFIIMKGIESTQRLLFSVYLDEALTVPRFVDAAEAANMRIMVEDVGPNVSDRGVRRTDRTLTAVSTGTTTTEKPTPPPEKKAYTKYYKANGYRSYLGGGGTYNYQTSRMYQGESPYGSNGVLRSIATFPSMTSDLSGATITSIKAYFYFDHWYNNSGGTAQVMLHGASTLPSTRPTLTYATVSGSWPKPGGRWVNIPSQFWPGFINGTYKGVGLGNGTSGNAYYGYARGSSTQIQIKYSK